MQKINKTNSEKYVWGDNCSGWRLFSSEDAGIIEELVPPGKTEVMHSHTHATQYFYILEGTAVMQFLEERVTLETNDGITVPPGTMHQFRNESNTDVRFLVISFPKNRWDRIEV